MLQDPDTALFLYVVLVLVGFLFGKRWQGVRDAITTAGTAAQTTGTK
jgi:hypothetical protein